VIDPQRVQQRGVQIVDRHPILHRLKSEFVRRPVGESALETARALGYQRIRLDTLPEMQPAQRLYESLGFHDIPPYYGQPVAGQRFMEAQLN
jgi:ribosomal protein S18 acetylase RimI-like enzyme